VIELQY